MDILIIIVIALIIIYFSFLALPVVFLDTITDWKGELLIVGLGIVFGFMLFSLCEPDPDDPMFWGLALISCCLVYLLLRGINLALHPKPKAQQEENRKENSKNVAPKTSSKKYDFMSNLERKFNITYDLNFLLYVDKFKISLHKYGRRYVAFQNALKQFENGNYGHIIRPDNELSRINGEGVIIGIYTCFDCCIEIDVFLWKDNNEQQIGTIVKCIDCKQQRRY